MPAAQFTMPVERRAWVRENIILSLVTDDGRRARTRDICPGGMFVYFPSPVSQGDWMSVEVSQPNASVRFHALAEIVRVEPAGAVYGAALKLHEQKLVPAPP